MSAPRKCKMTEFRRIMRHLLGDSRCALVVGADLDEHVDWVGDFECRRRTTEFRRGRHHIPTLQTHCALSFAQAGFYSLTCGVCTAMENRVRTSSCHDPFQRLICCACSDKGRKLVGSLRQRGRFPRSQGHVAVGYIEMRYSAAMRSFRPLLTDSGAIGVNSRDSVGFTTKTA